MTKSGQWTLAPTGKTPWAVAVRGIAAGGRRIEAELELTPPEPVAETERIAAIPPFNPRGSWNAGARPAALRAYECSLFGALIPESVSATADDGAPLVRGTDYEVEPDSGAVGRLAGGRLKEGDALIISYVYVPYRLDAVLLRSDGAVCRKPGAVNGATPLPPAPAPGEAAIANINFSGRPAKLSEAMIFPVTDEPLPAQDHAPEAEALLPRTLAKLRGAERLRYLAWGDSVTAALYLPEHERWPFRFAAHLRARFPRAPVDYVNMGWGGRNTRSFFAEPPGSKWHYEEKVLGARADLVTVEFVNDAGLPEQELAANYGRILADARAAGTELILMTPHYVRPDWMGMAGEKNCDEDPRSYVRFLRAFARDNKVALADASRFYGHLWREGIPYNTLMTNAINHPDIRGMDIFMKSLCEWIP